jgi:hypothetical protein
VPWSIPYLLPGSKWLPIYTAPQSWQVVSSPPAFDESSNRVAPEPPPGKAVYWWLQPKEIWPYRDEMPWESKQLGAWPSSKIAMSEDLKPSIWPGPHRAPKFGFIKLKMPGEPNRSFNEIPFTHFKIHTRYLSPDEMKVMTTITPFGPRYYLQSENWEYKELEYKQFKVALGAKRRGQIQRLLAETIAYGTEREPKPSVDLFS